MLWGVDISAYQPNFDLFRCRDEGFDFAICKSTEGAGWKSPNFHRQMNDSRAAGLVTAAYHFLRNDGAAAQVSNVVSMVPKDCPVILDIEATAGNIDYIWDVHRRLWDAGYHTPVMYLSRPYWTGIGSPGLGGLPPLWYPHYLDYNGGYASEIYYRNQAFHDSHWGGFGGLPVAILQFTSSATVAGSTPIDANAYRGTRAELEALFGGQPVEEEVPEWASEMIKHILWCFTGSYEPLQVPGHPNKIDGTPVPWLNYTRWNDLHSLEEAGRAAGRTAALRELLTAIQSDPGTYDRALVKQRVKDAISAKVVDEVVGRISVNVESPAEPTA